MENDTNNRSNSRDKNVGQLDNFSNPLAQIWEKMKDADPEELAAAIAEAVEAAKDKTRKARLNPYEE